MFGPAPIPPPRRGARAARVILCVLYLAVPPATIGILSWIPMLRLAVRSRRGWDWLWFGVVAVLASGAFVLVGQSDDDNSWQSELGVAGLILLALGVPVYFLVADLLWYRALRSRNAPPTGLPGADRPPVAPWPAAPPVPAWTFDPVAQSTPVHAPALPPAPAPAGLPAPTAPNARIDRVRAELDELSAYLRNQEGA